MTQFEACHIVPVFLGGDYTTSNGLLLSREFHSLYDYHLWSIYPETLLVELILDDPYIVGTIYDYSGIKVNLNPDYLMKINLIYRWNIFMDKKKKFII